MNTALVSIICTCYNQGSFIVEALDSVCDQAYDNLELIIIDNGSKDKSVAEIQRWIDQNGDKINFKTLFHSKTINYCQSFNRGLAMIKGKYLIDLSGDDVLLPDHVNQAVKTLETHGEAVYFSNAFLEKKETLDCIAFYPVLSDGQLQNRVHSGDVYRQVVQSNFLCAATLVFPSSVILHEGGYDETLSYEDFDIIVRLARKYKFVFNPYIGVRKRILKTSFSAQQYKVRHSVMLPSTLKVCKKIQEMNQTPEESKALVRRIMFETKHALASANFDVAAGFLEVAKEIKVSGFRYRLFRFWEKTRLDLSWFYNRVVKIR